MRGWPEATIGDLVAPVATVDPARAFGRGTFAYVDLSAVDRERKQIVEATATVGTDAPSRARQVLASGDILVSTVRPNLNAVALVEPEFDGAIGSTGFTVLRPDAQVDSEYLFHWVRSPAFVRGMVRRATGANYPAVSDRIVRESRIPLPPINEQRRIARVLEAAEDVCVKRRVSLAQVDRLRHSLFQENFGSAQRDGEEWKTEPITEVCSLIVDCVNRTAPTVDFETPFKMIRTTNVKNGKVDITAAKYVEADTFARWNRRATPVRGDVLLTREAPVGEVGVLDSDELVFLGQRLMLYRADPDRLTTDYLVESFRSPFLHQQFARYASGSTVKHLPLPACRSFEIVVPPLPRQQAFSEQMRALEAMRERGIRHLAHLDTLFASLQQRAFAGEL